MHTCICIHVYRHTYVNTCMYIYTVSINVCIYIYVYIHGCIQSCICVHTSVSLSLYLSLSPFMQVSLSASLVVACVDMVNSLCGEAVGLMSLLILAAKQFVVQVQLLSICLTESTLV